MARKQVCMGWAVCESVWLFCLLARCACQWTTRVYAGACCCHGNERQWHYCHVSVDIELDVCWTTQVVYCTRFSLLLNWIWHANAVMRSHYPHRSQVFWECILFMACFTMTLTGVILSKAFQCHVRICIDIVYSTSFTACSGADTICPVPCK